MASIASLDRRRRRKQIAKKLLRLRKEAGLTMEQAAHRVGIHKSRWFRFENGGSIPSEIMAQIVKAFDVSFNEMVASRAA